MNPYIVFGLCWLGLSFFGLACLLAWFAFENWRSRRALRHEMDRWLEDVLA